MHGAWELDIISKKRRKKEMSESTNTNPEPESTDTTEGGDVKVEDKPKRKRLARTRTTVRKAAVAPKKVSEFTGKQIQGGTHFVFDHTEAARSMVKRSVKRTARTTQAVMKWALQLLGLLIAVASFIIVGLAVAIKNNADLVLLLILVQVVAGYAAVGAWLILIGGSAVAVVYITEMLTDLGNWIMGKSKTDESEVVEAVVLSAS